MEFNKGTSSYYKAVTLEYTINKPLFFPKLSIIGYSSKCLLTRDTIENFDCSCIDCDECIFDKKIT